MKVICKQSSLNSNFLSFALVFLVDNTHYDLNFINLDQRDLNHVPLPWPHTNAYMTALLVRCANKLLNTTLTHNHLKYHALEILTTSGSIICIKQFAVAKSKICIYSKLLSNLTELKNICEPNNMFLTTIFIYLSRYHACDFMLRSVPITCTHRQDFVFALSY